MLTELIFSTLQFEQMWLQALKPKMSAGIDPFHVDKNG
jgi:hypothetical protein